MRGAAAMVRPRFKGNFMASNKAVLGIDQGGFYYGNNRVFTGVSFQLDDARTALVGENGAGKSTLLKCLTGELELNEGQIVKSRGFRTGYLAQDVPHELLEKPLRQILQESLERAHHDDAAFHEWKIDVLLADLGISDERAALPFSAFSGGWQRLVLIAAATALEEPNLLILDEPTNHLDLTHLARLEDWLLNNTNVPMLIVSHDREFLDKITTRTIFLRTDGAHKFATSFIEARTALLQRDAADAAKRAQEDKEVERLKEMVNRYKAWGVLNASFHKKQKTTEKRIERIQDERTNIYTAKQRDLALHDGALQAKTALTIENLTVATPDGARQLYHIERLAVKPGDRVALLGANGTGKSLLLKALAAAYNPDQQHYETGAAIRYSPAADLVYFDQRMQILPLEKTLLDYIEDGDLSNRSRTLSLLAQTGFRAHRAQSKIRELSYGERSRLLFLKMKLMQPNFYLLDEPTNHIDIDGQEQLEEQLTNTEVSCIFVSHDRYFTRSAATRFFEIKPPKTGTTKQIAKLVEVEGPEEFFERQAEAAEAA